MTTLICITYKHVKAKLLLCCLVLAVAPPLIGFLVGTYGFSTRLTTVSIFAVAAALVVLTLPETKGKALKVE